MLVNNFSPLLYLNFFRKVSFSGSLTLYQTTKFLDWSKLKAFADDKTNMTEKLKFVLERVENIVGKGENAGYQCFQKASYTGLLKVVIVW